MAEKIRCAADSGGNYRGGSCPPGILRIEVDLAHCDALSWLEAQNAQAKTYWEDRERQFEAAGIGEEDVVEGGHFPSYESLFRRLHVTLSGSGARVRYYGGIRFSDRGARDSCWQSFGSFRFVLPRFELFNYQGKSALACNLLNRRDGRDPVGEILSALDTVVFPGETREGEIPLLMSRTDSPDKNGWQRGIRSATRLFDRGSLQKIVLARKSLFEFKDDLNPTALLRRLKSTLPECFHFCNIPKKGVAFIGASPERLYLRRGRSIHTEAIAGTRPRGESAEADENLSQDLLHNDKDLREHRIVVEGIREGLAPVCESLSTDDQITVLKLTQCQHLLTAFEGTLRDGILDQDLLSRLHPTSAVGGCPSSAALEEIGRIEPFDRGWYTGPIGWVSEDVVEFAVAIRCGLVEGTRLSLFSGAGIVRGSTAEGEWNEIENKIGDFVRALPRS